MGLLKLSEKHSHSKLEESCSRALLYSKTPSYKSIKNLLAAMKKDSDPVSQNPDPFHLKRNHRHVALQELPDTTDVKDHDQSEYH